MAKRLSREQSLMKIAQLKRQGWEQVSSKSTRTIIKVYLNRGSEQCVVTYTTNGWFSIE